MKINLKALATAGIAILATLTSASEIHIATVDNSDMLRVKELSKYFLEKNPDVSINWTIHDESTLRIRLTRDNKRAQSEYDIYTLGYLQAFNWSKSGKLDPAPSSVVSTFASQNLIASIINGFQFGGNFYGLPFYGESSMTYYRKDRLLQYGLSISKEPTWSEIEQLLADLKLKSSGKFGNICLRGKAGWGENIALMTTIANSFGGRWYNEEWKTDVTSQAWHDAIDLYLQLQKDFGLPSAWENGFSQNLTAFTSGNCDIWVDSTAAGSTVAATLNTNQVGYSYAPYETSKKGSSWLWSWGFAVSSTSLEKTAAWRFIQWATSEEYQQLVAEHYGIGAVPPGTRTTLYNNPDYKAYAPFAAITIESIEKSDMLNPTSLPTPYNGIQFVQTPEFEQSGEFFAKRLSDAVKIVKSGQDFDISKLQKDVSEFADAAHRVATYMERNDLSTSD